MTLIDTWRVQTNTLIIANVAPALVLPHKKLGVEAPGYDWSRNKIVVAIDVDSMRQLKELTTSTSVSHAIQGPSFVVRQL